jgi:HlyD family secretion protein
MAQRPRLLALLAVVLLAGVAWWYYTGLVVPAPRGVVASGTLEAEEVDIASEVAGRVAQLPADEGDRVKAGDILVKLDDSLPKLQLEMAPLSERRPLELQLEKMTIRSPLDGVVGRRSIHVGEVVTPGATLMVVTQLDQAELTLYVPEREIGRVKVGQKVEVRVDSFPDVVFPGEVTFINSNAEFTPRNVQTQKDRMNLVFAVKVKIPNPDLRLKPGMPADATILDKAS